MYLVKDKEDDYMIDEAKCIDIYLKQQDKNLKEATIKAKLKVIKQFLDYCIANEIGDIRNIQKNILVDQSYLVICLKMEDKCSC